MKITEADITFCICHNPMRWFRDGERCYWKRNSQNEISKQNGDSFAHGRKINVTGFLELEQTHLIWISTLFLKLGIRLYWRDL